MMKKTEIVRKVIKILEKYVGKGNIADTRFYFNNKAWCFYTTHEEYPKIIHNIKGSDYTYSNDETITMTFEGHTDILYWNMRHPIQEELYDLFKEYGYYSERGHSWSFSLYPNYR